MTGAGPNGGWLDDRAYGLGNSYDAKREGRRLSTDLQAARCSSIGVGSKGELCRCEKPRGHSELVPHGGEGMTWYSPLA
jgi:hypothetical protein